jgi:peptide/nickel transport system permease protein
VPFKQFLVRLAGVALIVVAATATAWVFMHALRPELFAGQHQSLPGYLERAFLHFDFGRSRGLGGRPVAALMREGVPADVSLVAGGVAVGFLGGVAGGLICGRRPRGVVSRALQGVGMVGMCTPVFVVGLVLLLLFGAEIGVLPFGVGIPLSYVPFSDNPIRWLGSLIVPWIVLGLPLAGMCLRVMLGQVVEVGDTDPIRLARAKGLPDAVVRRRHIAPLAVAPTAMLAGSAMPLMITNAVLVERVFQIPGVFSQILQAVGTANTTLILGMTAVGAMLIAVATLVFDLLLAWLDPRARAAYAGR